MEWLKEPPRWDEQGATLSVVTGGNTDFWRTTHYGFVRQKSVSVSYTHLTLPTNSRV